MALKKLVSIIFLLSSLNLFAASAGFRTAWPYEKELKEKCNNLAKQAEQTKIMEAFNKQLDKVAQSHAMHWFNKHGIAQFYETIGGDRSASPSWQNLGKEAQDNLGIPSEYQVPVKKAFVWRGSKSVIGHPHEIEVLEYLFEKKLYGAQRSEMHKAATHIKYNDIATKNALGTTIVTAGILSSLKKMMCHGLKKTPLALFIASAAYGTGKFMEQVRTYYSDKRSEKEGLAATQCYVCVEEYLKDNALGSQADVEKIAEKLKQEDRVCDHHQEA